MNQLFNKEEQTIGTITVINEGIHIVEVFELGNPWNEVRSSAFPIGLSIGNFAIASKDKGFRTFAFVFVNTVG